METIPPALSRRRVLALLLPALVGSRLRAEPPARFAQDIDFLLAEFEAKAAHFFPVKVIDWRAVSAQFRDEAKRVSSDVEHVKLCARLVARLRDGHAGFADLKVKMPDESAGRQWTGPGCHLLEIDARVFIRQAFAAAQEAGITPGMEVEKIDGTPASEWLKSAVARLSEDRGYSTPHMARYYACHTGLADWAGTKMALDLRHDGERNSVTLTRSGIASYVPIGPVFPPAKLAAIGRQRYGRTAAGHGYIHLRDVPGDLPAQLDKMLPALGDIRGLILDTRANGGGGCDHEAVFARFIPAFKRWRQYRGAGEQPFAGSMVVIVDAGVRSAGETVAGMLKEDGRAFMIGDAPTAGMSSQKATVTVPSGLFSVRFSIASNKGRFNGGRGIEGLGVPPHELTPYEPADLLRGVDTQIRRAEEMLTRGLPKERVPWEQIA